MKLKNITIQACGGAGDGSLAAGALVARAFVKMGYYILIHDTFPAEIRGFGKTISEVRIATRDVAAKADSVDILIGLNNLFAIEQMEELGRNGIIIYDSKPGITVKDFESVPNFAGNFMNSYGLPLEHVAQKVTGRKLGKNIMAAGFLARILSLPPDVFQEVLKELFTRKGEEVVKNNVDLFMKGYDFKEIEHINLELDDPAHGDEVYTIISGNDAMAQGAINAGLVFFGGYPITPASKLMEYLAKHLPTYGGAVLQTEDEIAAIGSVLGSWFAGQRSMTATSGPGLSLMSEIINLGVMTETPLVIVNAMRGGPSTGLPTKVEQADLNLALFGAHGDSPRVVLAPATIGECYEIMQDAFDIAEKYQTPVIVLSDKFIGMSYIAVPADILKGERSSTRVRYEGAPEQYKRFQLTPSGVSPWAVPGDEGCFYTTTGLEHNELGGPDYDLTVHHDMTEKRFAKFSSMVPDLPPPQFYGEVRGKNLLITWGSTFGAVMEAAERLSEEGFSIRVAKVKSIYPQHEEVMRNAIESAEKVLIPEQNRFGQFARFMKGHYGISAEEIHLPGGAPVRPNEAVQLLKGRLQP